MVEIVVVIPTRGRTRQLAQALDSLLSQTRKPDQVYVVGETTADLPDPLQRGAVESSIAPSPLTWLLNERDPGFGGSMNSSLTHMLAKGLDPGSTYVALLDDDDTWEPTYLERVLVNTCGGKNHLVISGVLRHERPDDLGHPHKVPTRLTSQDFLTGNPHVQNSNLVLRLDSLLLAGGWDESLPSTHDRDLLIRVLDLPAVSIGFVNEHLVHYWALDHPRLSTKGSIAKKEGLLLFLRKYRHRMGPADVEAFRNRARGLFNIDPEEAQPQGIGGPPALRPIEGELVDLVLGFTVSRKDSGTRLVTDIVEFLGPTNQVKSVVVCDNLGDSSDIEMVVRPLREAGIHYRVVTPSDVEGDASSGRLTAYYLPRERRQGVAFGRTALHRYLLKEASWHPKCVVWILDDDVRLDSVRWGASNEVLSAREILGLLSGLREEKVSVAVGGISGDPPLPAAMTVRGQLLDICEAIRAGESPNEGRVSVPTISEDPVLRDRFPEYHHDLSLRHRGHLEIPFGLPPDLRTQSIAGAEPSYTRVLNRLIHGQSVSRPGPVCTKIEYDVLPTRGGNTFVLDVDLLRAVPNLSPRLGSISLRRGDTLWCSILKRLGGALVGAEPRRVIGIPMAIRQERGGDPGNALSWDTFVGDALGRALTRSLDPVLRLRGEARGHQDLTAMLTLPEEEIDRTIVVMKDLIERQIGDLLLTSWRVRGLCAVARELLAKCGDDASLPLLQSIATFYSEKNLATVIDRLREVPWGDLRAFLQELPRHQREYARSLPPVPPEGWVERQRVFLEAETGHSSLAVVGRGDEGVVFANRDVAIKFFFDGTAHLTASQMAFLTGVLSPSAILHHIVPIRAVSRSGPRLAFVTDFVPGSRYSGGHGESLFRFLREARAGAFIVKNVSADNLVSTSAGVTYVDIGDDIVPFSEAGYRQMAKRVFLTFHWHFRTDLKQLLRASLTNEALPELVGFPEFWDALQVERVDQLTDPLVLTEMTNMPHQTVLDLGCGDGRLSRKVSRLPADVFGFDPGIDAGSLHCNEDEHVHLLSEPQLEARLAQGPPFEGTLCSMVLCEVEPEPEAERLISRARMALDEEGMALFAICNPFQAHDLRSALWTTMELSGAGYHEQHSRRKVLQQNGRTRVDRFRPLSWYVDALHRGGFEVDHFKEVGGIELDGFLPAGEVAAVRAHPTRHPRDFPVSLLIKTCPMEWRTIDFQVRHLVRQLEGPQRFAEKVVVADIHDGPFPRSYDCPDSHALLRALESLRQAGVVDKIVIPPRTEVDIRHLTRSWFGLDCGVPSSSGGEATYAFLRGLEACSTDLVLHADSDCLVGRMDRNHDYLGEMASVLEHDRRAITATLTIPRSQSLPYVPEGPEGPRRVESRLGLVSLERIRALIPLPNSKSEGGQLAMSWYRSLDSLVHAGRATSYRGGDPRTYFVHVPNSKKRPVNSWFNILQAFERGCQLPAQSGKVDLVGESHDWVGRRSEDMVFIVRGRDVPIPKIRRCIRSLLMQRDQGWGVVFVDGGSENGMEEYLRYFVLPQFGGRASLVCNLEPLLPVQNMIAAVREVCSRPSSIIVTLDADDALTSPGAVDRIRAAYAQGADLTVGSMVRTDKDSDYPVELANPRSHGGGNVWQHLRTFRKALFDQLTDEDFQVDGAWVPLADDWAYMLPMVELAKHPIHLEDKLYLYDPSPAHAKRDRTLAEATISAILAKPSKNREASA